MTTSHNNAEKVILWTRQNKNSIKELSQQGVYRVKKEYIEEQFEDIAQYYIKLYSWFTEAASKRVPKPVEVEFPIWCSISDTYMLRVMKDTVVYVLEVDPGEVIYFNSGKWDHILNHLYIPKDDRDARQYKEKLKSKGFLDGHSFIEGRYSRYYPIETKMVMDSWSRLFEIEEWDPFKVQANIWEIRQEQIKKIIQS
jgi:hypothetical protein